MRYAVVVGLQLLAEAVATDPEGHGDLAPQQLAAKRELITAIGQDLDSRITQEPEIAVQAILALALEIIERLKVDLV